jgi:transmembrane sensor
MENRENFKTDDFIHDAYFREWVLAPTPASDFFWKEWLTKNPRSREDIEAAKTIVLSFGIKEALIEEFEIKEGINSILLTVKTPQTPVIPLFKRSWFRIAATVALLITIGLWEMNTSIISKQFSKADTYTEFSNKEDKPLSIVLPDGSTVVLQKNSEIRYEKDFSGQTRAVQFKGEGLFDVVKNLDKPFVVYSGDIVTKVLGTSFIVKSFESDNQITVDVLRGKVLVTTLKSQAKKEAEKSEILLTPNQKAIFSKTAENLEHTLVATPQAIVSNDTIQEITFNETPVVEIFTVIGKKFGVDIVFDSKLLKNCAMTTSFKDETLYEALNLICKGIDAQYKLVGVQVIIEGKACK